MLVTLMIMSCFCAGSRDSTFRSFLPYRWPRHVYVLSVYWPKGKRFGSFIPCLWPYMIMSCLCTRPRESAFGSCLPCWWHQHDYVLPVCWPYTVILFSSRYLFPAKSICPTWKQTIYIFHANSLLLHPIETLTIFVCKFMLLGQKYSLMMLSKMASSSLDNIWPEPDTQDLQYIGPMGKDHSHRDWYKYLAGWN